MGAHFLREKVFFRVNSAAPAAAKTGKGWNVSGRNHYADSGTSSGTVWLYGTDTPRRRPDYEAVRARVPAFWCCPSPAIAAMWNIRSAPPRPRTVGAGK